MTGVQTCALPIYLKRAVAQSSLTLLNDLTIQPYIINLLANEGNVGRQAAKEIAAGAIYISLFLHVPGMKRIHVL